MENSQDFFTIDKYRIPVSTGACGGEQNRAEGRGQEKGGLSRWAMQTMKGRCRVPRMRLAMFRCHVRGGTSAREDLVSEVFTIDGRRVLVERIPAQLCERCGEPTFSRATTEKVRRLVHGEGRPVRTVPLDVFAMA